MGRRLRLIGVAVGWSILLMCSAAKASLHIVSNSIDIDDETRTTGFALTFDHAPDFLTLDSVGRQKDSFQYYMNWNAGKDLFNAEPGLAIIRGEEIHVAHALRVRDSLGDDPSPTSGGWGRIRGTVPFNLDGDTIHFTMPWDMLGEKDHRVRFAVETYRFGSLVDEQTRLIPLPTAFWAGGGMLVIVVVAQIVMSRHRPT